MSGYPMVLRRSSQASNWLHTHWLAIWREHVRLFSFLVAITICGLGFGGVVAGELNRGDTMVLVAAIQHLMEAIRTHTLAQSGDLWWQRMVADGQVLALIALFGVSVIGVPLVVIALFLRAFSIGFAVGFTILQFGWKGLLLASFGIFLHQLISLVALLMAAVAAIRFSTTIVRQQSGRGELSMAFVKYSGFMLLCAGIMMLGAAVQVYLTIHVLQFSLR